jgi:Ala-tRNA(Pro) deacylase
MAIAITMKEYLDNLHIKYEVIEHRRTVSTLESCEVAHIPGDKMAKSVLLGDEESYLMAVVPATCRVQMDRVDGLTGRKLEFIEEDELVEAFADCEPGSVPPTGKPYGIQTLVDDRLLNQPDIYFESGDHGRLIHISGSQFQTLFDDPGGKNISKHI